LLTPDGTSYTEEEYGYALERGLKVLAVVHDKSELITLGKCDPENAPKRAAFRDRVKQGRLVKPWSSAREMVAPLGPKGARPGGSPAARQGFIGDPGRI
jgi:hypothetical protein